MIGFQSISLDCFEIPITEDISGGMTFFAPFGGKVVDVIARFTEVGTLELSGITDVMTAISANQNIHAGSILSDITAGQSISVVAGGRDERGTIFVVLKR